MPKPSLYARRAAAVTLAALVAGVFPAFGASVPKQDAVPCALCTVLVLTPGQMVLLDGPLDGIEVLIRSVPAPGIPADVEKDGLMAIRRLEGQGGLILPLEAAGPLALDTLSLAHRIVVDLGQAVATADLVFRLKTRLTDIRAANGAARLGILASAASVEALLGADLAPYVDFVARADATAPPYPAKGRADAIGAVYLPADLLRQATGLTPERWLVRVPPDAIEAKNLIADVARTARVFGEGLVPGGAVEIRCGDIRLPTFLDPESLDTVALGDRCDHRPIAATPATTALRQVSLSTGAIAIRAAAAEGRFAEGVDVVGARTLTVREIIARHQAAAARQRRDVRRTISTGTMTLTFEAPGFPAPVAITSEAVIYSDVDRLEIEQRAIRVNGIAFPGGGVPRLPLLEPERVASPPLAITLTDVYRYTLAGEDDVAGVRCYVVAFDPVDRSRPLFAGRAWIAADSFAMLKVSAVQTGLRGPIVSSEQTDEFRRESTSVWLLARSEVRQLYEGPGYRTPIHRVLTIAGNEVNPAGFDQRRSAAYASPSIMLRDTPDGFRYLQRAPAGDSPARAVEPTVAGRADHVRTIALGVILDPNISRPLPFAGLSYVDFNLFGTGTQLNGFFGGTYGQLAVSVPSLRGTRWQLAGRAFGILSSYNDRAFVGGREIYAANISQRPAHASAWLLRPLTARLTVRAGYEFDFTGFARADSTADSFTVPASQAAHGLRLTLEGQRAGWTASAWWSGVHRAGWRFWGESGETASPLLERYSSEHQDFQRYGAGIGRSFVVSPRLVGRMDAAWMAGHDLDRFSRYTFGSFDNRLRGYPSALIRYDRGAVVRGTAAWAAGRVLRIDGFVDTAYVHDPGFGRRPRNYSGIGAAAEVPAPFKTLAAVEWGYGFQGINADGGRGTHVVRISGYKIF